MFNYRTFSFIFVAILLITNLYAQKRSLISPYKEKQKTPLPTLGDNDHDQVKQVIMTLFDAMRANDGYTASQLFESTATLSSVYVDQNGQTQYRTNPVQEWIDAISKPKTDVFDEKIWEYKINIDGPLAKAWTPYTFYLNEDLSHCGVNDFEMVKRRGQWKISRIIDTRRKTDCIADPKLEINSLMDNWHQAAARADEKTFFSSMTPDAIYVGTDASERWIRDEMKEWSKEYFMRQSAWSFTPTSRNVTLDANGETAWFDELLDTWMGTCRSTGIVQKVDNRWKIKYYHLSVAVPNDKINDYLRVIGKSR